MYIVDPLTGDVARVNEENQLVTRAVTVPYLSHLNQKSGAVWSIPLDAVAPSGATWFMVFFNTSGENIYAVAQMSITTTVGGVFRASRITGTPSGGTAIVATSLNLGKTTVPNATIQSGASITGLTEGNLIAPLYLPTGQPGVAAAESRIIIPPGTVGLGLKAPAACIVNGYITICELPQVTP